VPVVVGMLTRIAPGSWRGSALWKGWLCTISAAGRANTPDLATLRQLEAHLADCEVLCATSVPAGLASRAPNARWFHGL
jgi:hypothetical protein